MFEIKEKCVLEIKKIKENQMNFYWLLLIVTSVPTIINISNHFWIEGIGGLVACICWTILAIQKKT